jgi:hypothetical protein
VRARRYARGEEQSLLPKVLEGRMHGAGSGEGLEEQLHGFLNLLIRVQDHSPAGIVYQPHRQTAAQFASARFVQDAAAQARPHHMKLCFAHRSLQCSGGAPGFASAVLNDGRPPSSIAPKSACGVEDDFSSGCVLATHPALAPSATKTSAVPTLIDIRTSL